MRVCVCACVCVCVCVCVCMHVCMQVRTHTPTSRNSVCACVQTHTHTQKCSPSCSLRPSATPAAPRSSTGSCFQSSRPLPPRISYTLKPRNLRPRHMEPGMLSQRSFAAVATCESQIIWRNTLLNTFGTCHRLSGWMAYGIAHVYTAALDRGSYPSSCWDSLPSHKSTGELV